MRLAGKTTLRLACVNSAAAPLFEPAGADGRLAAAWDEWLPSLRYPFTTG